MALLKRLTLGQRGFLCVQYKVEGRTQVHRDYCAFWSATTTTTAVWPRTLSSFHQTRSGPSEMNKDCCKSLSLYAPVFTQLTLFSTAASGNWLDKQNCFLGITIHHSSLQSSESARECSFLMQAKHSSCATKLCPQTVTKQWFALHKSTPLSNNAASVY